MIVRVLGSAAGGGVPQWNCRGVNSSISRRNPREVRRRTQSSLAISPDGQHWVVLNASPDMREQIEQAADLQPDPNGALRNSPITDVVLTNADVDHVTGLLTLRERHRFAIHATQRVQDVLRSNPIFNVLDPALVERRTMALDRPIEIHAGGGGSQLSIVPFLVPGKIALYLENVSAGPSLGTSDGDTVGLEISDGRTKFHYVPCCAEVDDALRLRLESSQLVFFDGTLFTDDEMITQGLSDKSGKRMGHISMNGPDGSMARLADLSISRRVFIHINNSNPVLQEGSPERAEIERQGWEVAFDGMELRP